jgi:hypothetical protein
MITLNPNVIGAVDRAPQEAIAAERRVADAANRFGGAAAAKRNEKKKKPSPAASPTPLMVSPVATQADDEGNGGGDRRFGGGIFGTAHRKKKFRAADPRHACW